MDNAAFLHIPKTGGRSVVLSGEEGALFSVNGVIGGHFPAFFLDEPCKLWTIVRDPVDRIYSLFHFSWFVNNKIDDYLDYLEEGPQPLDPNRKGWASRKVLREDKQQLRVASRVRYEDGVYPDTNEGTVQRCVDKKAYKWFVEEDTSDIKTLTRLEYIPGICLPTQWDYLKNDVGHDIEVIHFQEKERIEEKIGGSLRHINKGYYSDEDREKDLTPERIERIKYICKDDYENIECLR